MTMDDQVRSHSLRYSAQCLSRIPRTCRRRLSPGGHGAKWALIAPVALTPFLFKVVGPYSKRRPRLALERPASVDRLGEDGQALLKRKVEIMLPRHVLHREIQTEFTGLVRRVVLGRSSSLYMNQTKEKEKEDGTKERKNREEDYFHKKMSSSSSSCVRVFPLSYKRLLLVVVIVVGTQQHPPDCCDPLPPAPTLTFPALLPPAPARVPAAVDAAAASG